jgi:hypothetical protein
MNEKLLAIFFNATLNIAQERNGLEITGQFVTIPIPITKLSPKGLQMR